MSDVEAIREYLSRKETTSINANAATVLLESRDDWRKRTEKLLAEWDEAQKELAMLRDQLSHARERWSAIANEMQDKVDTAESQLTAAREAERLALESLQVAIGERDEARRESKIFSDALVAAAELGNAIKEKLAAASSARDSAICELAEVKAALEQATGRAEMAEREMAEARGIK